MSGQPEDGTRRGIGERGDFDDLIADAHRVARDAARRGIPPIVGRHDSPSDLAQSVARELLLNAEQVEYRGDLEFGGLVRNILRRKITERLRRYRAQSRDAKREFSTDRDDSSPSNEPEAESPSPSSAVAFAELSSRVQAALERLPERSRTVIELRMGGMTHDEIARELGITRVNSEQILSRARAELADVLS